MNYINQYYQLIVSKKIVVSKKVQTVLEKVIQDLNNPSTYHFDEEKANRPIEFIESFCKHSKGQWAGKPIKLDLWQKAVIQIIFGFVDKKGFRKYREVLIVVGRKNGKSTLLSAIALYMLFGDKEGGAQICCVASKKDQAKIVFDEARNMVFQSKVLSKHIRKRKTDLYFDKTFSTFEPLASDSNTLDGLNIHCGIIDELHSIKDRNIYDVTKQSMTSRQQPILFMISTSGFVRENIFDDMYAYSEDVINGKITDDRFISFIYELDHKNEWTKPTAWEKANPSLRTVKDVNFLQENVERAKVDIKFLPTLLTKDFNIRETNQGAWLSFDTINNTDTYDFEQHQNIYAIGGVDLSSVGDLTCATVIYRYHEKWYCKQMYFIPRGKAEEKERTDKVPYKIWEQQGLITFCEGSRVNYSDVTQWFVDLRNINKIYTVWVGYDTWGSQYWCDEMKANQFTMLPVIQGAKTMSNPMKILESDLKEKKINYNNNPILKWCLSNTQIETDKNENIRPIKGKNQKQRIDGAMSLIDAYVILQEKYNDYIAMTN